MMIDMKKYAPPGLEVNSWKQYTGIGMFGCGVLSFYSFVSGLIHARAMLFDQVTGELTGNFGGWNFSLVLGDAMLLFWFAAVGMAAFLIRYYFYFFEGSKSIYTMARVKSFWELHIRCWTLPVLGAGALILCRVVLIAVYFLVFLLATPKGVPLPGFYQLLGGLLS